MMLILTTGIAYAQEEKGTETQPHSGFDKSKLFFGGNFGLNFGEISLVNISPQVGYRFNPVLAAGAGLSYIYSGIKYRDFNGNRLYRDDYNVAGINIFGRVYPIEQVLLQLQPEMNYTWGKRKSYSTAVAGGRIDGKFVPSLLAGAGASLPAGRGAFIAMIQYDLLQDARSPYGNRPFFNFGYNVGF